MKRLIKLVACLALISIAIGLVFAPSSFAASDTADVTETTFFGNVEDDGKGCGVYMILTQVLDILTFGVGIAAAIGIAIAGTTYLTSSGNPQQTVKAKHRIFEIVLGLAVYAVLYSTINFLLPNGHFNSNPSCATISDQELAARKAAEAAKKQQAQQKTTTQTTQKTNTNTNKQASLEKWYDAMTKQFQYMKNAKYGSNFKSDFKLSKKAGTCITFVSTSLQRLGVIPKNTYVWISKSGKISGSAASYIKKHKATFEILYPNKTASQLKKNNKIKKGDIVAYNVNRGKSNDASHIMVFMGFNKKGKPLFNTWGHRRALNKEHPSYANRKINMIIRLKKTSV